jgi:ribose transport system substrate-binding protein
MLTVVVASALVLTACGDSDDSDSGSSSDSAEAKVVSTASGPKTASGANEITEVAKDDATIGVILWAPIESVETVKDEISAAGDRHGWNFEFAQANGSPDAGRSAAQTLIQKNVDAIVNLAVDNKALAGPIRQAQSKGIPFVSQFVGPTDGVVDISPSTAVDTETITDFVVKRMGGKGKIAVINSNAIPVLANREELFKQYLEDKAPDVEIVEDYELQFEPSAIIDARNATDAFLSEHDDLDAIWTSFDDPGAGAALAVDNAGRAGDVFVTGYDGDSVFVKKMGADKAAQATIRHNYRGLSEETLWAVNELMKGNYVPRGIWFADPLLTPDQVGQIDELVGDGIVPCGELKNPEELATCEEAVNVKGESKPVPAEDQ